MGESGWAVRMAAQGAGLTLAVLVFSLLGPTGKMILGLLYLFGLAAYNFWRYRKKSGGKTKNESRPWEVLQLMCVLILAIFLHAIWSELGGPARLISVSVVVLVLAIVGLCKWWPLKGGSW